MFFKKIIRHGFFSGLLLGGIFLSLNFTHETKKEKYSKTDFSKLKDGDIVFQISEFGQGKAIQLATHSKYTHCGIVFKENNKLVVYEAVQPVKKTSMQEWVKDGKENYYIARRLKNSNTVLTPEVVSKMKSKYKQMEGKNYDLYFGWSDDKIYCSELVWKLYKEGTGMELGKLQKLKDFDLSNPIVKLKLQERYGNNIPYEEKVISPAAIFDSELLETVE